MLGTFRLNRLDEIQLNKLNVFWARRVVNVKGAWDDCAWEEAVFIEPNEGPAFTFTEAKQATNFIREVDWQILVGVRVSEWLSDMELLLICKALFSFGQVNCGK